MQIDAGISEVNVVTFSGGPAPPRTKALGPATEFIGGVLSHSERLPGPDPPGSAEAG